MRNPGAAFQRSDYDSYCDSVRQIAKYHFPQEMAVKMMLKPLGFGAMAGRIAVPMAMSLCSLLLGTDLLHRRVPARPRPRRRYGVPAPREGDPRTPHGAPGADVASQPSLRIMEVSMPEHKSCRIPRQARSGAPRKK